MVVSAHKQCDICDAPAHPAHVAHWFDPSKPDRPVTLTKAQRKPSSGVNRPKAVLTGVNKVLTGGVNRNTDRHRPNYMRDYMRANRPKHRSA